MLISKEVLGFIGVALVLVAYLPYLRDIIRKKVIPHPFSWLIWTATATAVFFIQTTNGSGPGAYPTATIALMAFSVFVLSYRMNKVRIKPLDILCLVIASAGIVVWLFIDQPLISLILLLSVEVIGFIPTIRKAIAKPYEDSISVWAISAFRHGFGLAAITHYNLVTILNPLVWIAMCVTFCTVVLWRRRTTKKPHGRVRQFRPHN